MSLSAFWFHAACLSGRIDLSGLRERLAAPGPLPNLSELVAAGLRVEHASRLLAPAAVPDVGPCLRLVDPGYPEALAGLPHAPPVLFLRGDAARLADPAVAVVGSRRCTQTGLRLARMLASAVAQAGGVVVSGLAHGIDQAAHGAAPDRTIAVLGQGFGEGLTAQQQRLAGAILDAGGLLLSEFPPGTPAARWTFPQRNRVIAGLSQATVVVEAGRRSGALITARLAAAAGREVLAVPGSPLAPASQGCLDLLAEGAAVVRGVDDVRALVPGAGARPGPTAPTGLPPGLADGLRAGASLDHLADATGLGVAELSATLVALELAGTVQRLPGDRFAFKEPLG